jgi:hypothetical protein
MRIEKLKCDGCGKEYELNTTSLTIRLINNDDPKVVSKFSLSADTVKVSIPRQSSLDFCNLTCFQAYIDKIKSESQIEI